MSNKENHHFLHFTKKERNGIILLTAIIIILIILPRLYPFFITQPTYSDTAFQNAVASLQMAPKDSGERYAYNNEHYRKREAYDDRGTGYDRPAGELFTFDPNTLSAEGWKKLGLRDKTISTIQKYISKGGRFRSPEDIHKIWGLRPGDADRLEPYVRIAAPSTASYTGAASPQKPVYTKPSYAPAIVDINQADTSAFIALPGIGSKLANRIVTFRDKLGGFYAVEQIGETFGLADSIFQKIKPQLRVGNSSVRQVNINTATLEEMKGHPYIRYQLANAIVQYRQQHGNFARREDLRNIMMVTEGMYNKLMPYVVVQ